MVLRGTFSHGIGEKFDERKLEARPVGSFFTEPKGVRHFGTTKDEATVLYFVGTGPSTQTISKNEIAILGVEVSQTTRADYADFHRCHKVNLRCGPAMSAFKTETDFVMSQPDEDRIYEYMR
jgi:hypothetical protein